MMTRTSIALFAACLILAGAVKADREITRADLLDYIRGGWSGMLIGGIEGLPHEFKYNDAPRDSLPEFTFLKDGARSDDDNDIEWMHIYYMDKLRMLEIPYPRIVEIWKADMNTGIWAANRAARKLMDEGVVPPATGDPARNSYASFNLSGQFCVEAFGMIAPGMPQMAAQIGLHYALISVRGEPLQATRYWTALISQTIFNEEPIARQVSDGLRAVDPSSAMAEVVRDAIKAHDDNPSDWKAARKSIHEKWFVERKWNTNSTPLNGAAVVLALLYGDGDFYKTLQYAMALGYDADCNAATAGAVIGYRIGFKRIEALPQFRMPDTYRNATRPSLPKESKVSDQAETLLRVCERVIIRNGGRRIKIDGQPGYRIKLQEPKPL